MNWTSTIIDGVEYFVINDAEFRVPLDFDPPSNTFVAVASPTGGLGNFPTLVGDMPNGAIPHEDSLHECSQLWVTPGFIQYTLGWSWWVSPLENIRLECLPLDKLIGHFFVYEAAGIKKVWRIIEVDEQRDMLLGKCVD